MRLELEDGARHVGWVCDQDDDTPHQAAVLERNGTSVTLRLPLGEHVDEVYRRWFEGGARHADDPDRTRYAYHPPRTLWFDGAWGRAALVDCYARSSLITGGGVGEGVIGCSMAAVGAAVGTPYDTAHGVESTVPGLGLWLQRTSLEQELTRGEDGLPVELDVRWRRQDSVPLTSRMNLTLRPSFRFDSRVPGDQADLRSAFVLNTSLVRSRPWREHVEVHRSVPAMMTIASWHPWTLEELCLRRDDDPIRALDGTARGPAWRRAVVAGLEPFEAPAFRPQFLFHYADVPGSPISRWFRLRRRYEEPLARLVAVAHWQRADLVGLVQELGTIIELVGYPIGEERHQSPRTTFAGHAERIVSQLPPSIAKAIDGWPDAARETYIAAKHADHQTPHQQELWRGATAAQLVLRLWIARRLGVSTDRIVRAMRVDRDARRIGWDRELL